MSKRKKSEKIERVGKYDPNLKSDGTTIDGGFPRQPKWTNPHDAWKVILIDFLQTIVICGPIYLILMFLLGLGLGESVLATLTGQVPIDANGVKNIVVLGVLIIVLVGLPILFMIDAIVYIVKGKRSFDLSKPIKKVWDKNSGDYTYRQ